MILLMSSEIPFLKFILLLQKYSVCVKLFVILSTALATLKPQAAGYVAPGAERVCVAAVVNMAQSVNLCGCFCCNRLENRYSWLQIWQWRLRYWHTIVICFVVNFYVFP